MAKPKTIDLTLNVDLLREAQEFFIKGKKGTYLDLRAIELENKQYNDFMIVVKVPKDKYEQGVKGAIVGYGKDWSLHNGGGGSAPQGQTNNTKVESEDLPF
jgi:hypothetical protein